jgi:hypothetical protein
MQKLFNFLMVGLTFVVLNVATVAAIQTAVPGAGDAAAVVPGMSGAAIQTAVPGADASAAPIGEGGEAGGPAAQDMSGNMINDGGHGANSAAEAEKAQAEKKAAAIANCLETSGYDQKYCDDNWGSF